MKIRPILSVLILFLLATVSCASASQTIVCLGDSITRGDNWVIPYVTHNENEVIPYPVKLNALMPNDTVINKGVNSDTTTGMLARYPTDVTANDPDFVVILGGTNDIPKNIPIETTESNLQTMYQWAVANGTTPILCTIMPVTGNDVAPIKQLNTWIINYANDHNLPLVDTYTLIDSPVAPGTGVMNSMFDSGDGLHPQNLGFNVIATAVYRGIKSNKYTHSKYLHITNSSSSQYVTVSKKLLYANIVGAKVDFSDIYLTQLDNHTMVPFWIENKINNKSANLWILLPPKTNDIVIHYGNVSSISQSCGYSTFPIFDHFDNSNINYGWHSVVAREGSTNIANSLITLKGGSSTSTYLNSKVNFSNGYAFRANASIGAAVYNMIGFIYAGNMRWIPPSGDASKDNSGNSFAYPANVGNSEGNITNASIGTIFRNMLGLEDAGDKRWISHTYGAPQDNVVNSFVFPANVGNSEGNITNAYHIYDIVRPLSEDYVYSVDGVSNTLTNSDETAMPLTIFANANGVVSADWVSVRVYPAVMPVVSDP